MIKFFRHIRRALLAENKFSKYLLYAIGEIILVVIGILIALQINTWNNEKLQKEDEKQLLYNLREEYRENLEILDKAIEKRNAQMGALDALHELIFQDQGTSYSTNQIDSLIGVSRYIPTFESRSGVLQEAMSSGQLKIIQNEDLRTLLSNYQAELDDLTKIENGVYEIILNNYNTYLIDNYTLTYSDYYVAQTLWKDNPIATKWKGQESNFTGESRLLLNDSKFESLLSLVNLWAMSSKDSASKMHQTIVHTLDLIDKELKND